MLSVALLKPQPGERVADLCASPGSKVMMVLVLLLVLVLLVPLLLVLLMLLVLVLLVLLRLMLLVLLRSNRAPPFRAPRLVRSLIHWARVGCLLPTTMT